MRKRTWIVSGLLVFVILLGLVAWTFLPTAIDALPGPIRARIPEEVAAFVFTPLPSALPRSLATPSEADPPVVVPTLGLDLVEPQITPSATLEPTPTQFAPETPANEDDGLSTVIVPSATMPPPTWTPSPEPTASPTALPIQFVVEGLQIMPQKFNNCGPANLTMVLNFYNENIDQLQVGERLKPNYDDRNVSPEEMIHYVNNETDLEARYFVGGDIELLKELIVHGFPVIVEKGLVLVEYQGWMGHYLTIHGFNDQEQSLMTKDTFLGPWDNSGLDVSYEKLEEMWEHFNYAFIVVFQESDELLIGEILGDKMVEPDQMWHRAAVMAQAKTENEPQNAFAWFNLGQSLTYVARLSGDSSLLSGAAAAFDKARDAGLPWRTLWYRFEPYQAYLEANRPDEVLALTETMINSLGAGVVEETHFYRSQALAAVGRDAEALQSLERAKSLNPYHSQMSSFELPERLNDD